MRAFRYHTLGTLGDLRLEDVPTPDLSAAEVLVRVHSASLNPVDWKIASGKWRFLVRGGLPRTMGGDFAGEVAGVGAGVTGFKRGDRVWGFVDPFRQANGTIADYCPVPAGFLFPLPRDIEYRDAAALACVGATAATLCDLTKISKGSNVLVNGASGGVGHVAVQLAKVRGARVTAVASGTRRAFVLSLGADEFLDYQRVPPSEWPGGFDAVLDCVPSLPRPGHHRLLRRGGHYATTLPDAMSYLLDPITNRFGRLHRHAVMIQPEAARMDELLGHVRAGRLRGHVEAEYSLEQAAEAVERSRSGRVQGKLVIRVASDERL
jgi:NADPH:quinone reductase-like Zn-dependent oxidoreductase